MPYSWPVSVFPPRGSGVRLRQWAFLSLSHSFFLDRPVVPVRIGLNIELSKHDRVLALNRAKEHGLDVEAVAFHAASLIAKEELKVCFRFASASCWGFAQEPEIDCSCP